MRAPKGGGGWQAIRYTLRKGREVGFLRLWRAMRSKNACKTCALGMGGQQGGMADEAGHFPEVCKKSLQAMTADMRGRIDPKFFQTFSIAQLQTLSPRELELAGRIVAPLIKQPNQDHYVETTWDGALGLIAHKMAEQEPNRSFFYSSGRSSNEAGFLLQLLARAYGTNNVSNCSYYCHQASGAGLMDSIGTPTATIALEDIEKCDLLFLIGGNPSSNHPRFMTQLMKLRNRGGKVVVVNPLREPGLCHFRVPSNVKSMLLGSEIASHYLQPAIGGDIALLAGISKAILEQNAHDPSFIESHTEDFQALRDFLQETPWTEIEKHSGIEPSTLQDIAAVFAQSQKTIFAWTMGITHHLHGTENVQWIANLALLRGMVGKPGAGLLPIRGHSNVQGLGTVGVSPFVRQAALQNLHELGIDPPKEPGHDTLASLEAAARGEVDFALCLGGNLFGASPDAAFMKEALGRIGTIVYLSTTLNTGHAHGLGQTTIVLPVRARDEEDQPTTQESMFNYVRLSDGGPARHEGTRTEVDVLCEIGALWSERDPSRLPSQRIGAEPLRVGGESFRARSEPFREGAESFRAGSEPYRAGGELLGEAAERPSERVGQPPEGTTPDRDASTAPSVEAQDEIESRPLHASADGAAEASITEPSPDHHHSPAEPPISAPTGRNPIAQVEGLGAHAAQDPEALKGRDSADDAHAPDRDPSGRTSAPPPTQGAALGYNIAAPSGLGPGHAAAPAPSPDFSTSPAPTGRDIKAQVEGLGAHATPDPGALKGRDSLDWRALKDHDAIRSLIARLIPSLKDIEDIGRSKREFHIAGRIHHQPAFHTLTGKAAFRPHPIPLPPALEPNQLRLMTIRSEGQFNTVVYEEEDLYRGQERRDVILLNPADLARLGLKPDDRVLVESPTGQMRGIRARPYDIAQGCAAMYFPEANALIPRTADPRSRTPAFKSVIVSVALDAAAHSEKPEKAVAGSSAGRDSMKAC